MGRQKPNVLFVRWVFILIFFLFLIKVFVFSALGITDTCMKRLAFQRSNLSVYHVCLLIAIAFNINTICQMHYIFCYKLAFFNLSISVFISSMISLFLMTFLSPVRVEKITKTFPPYFFSKS